MLLPFLLLDFWLSGRDLGRRCTAPLHSEANIFQGPGHLPGHVFDARRLISEIGTVLLHPVFGALVAGSAAESGIPLCIVKDLHN